MPSVHVTISHSLQSLSYAADFTLDFPSQANQLRRGTALATAEDPRRCRRCVRADDALASPSLSSSVIATLSVNEHLDI